MPSKKQEKKTAETSPAKFEEALGRLEKIVKELEEGELDLDKSLELFEEGVGLSRTCMKKLDEAQARVELLLRDAKGDVRKEEWKDAGNEDE